MALALLIHAIAATVIGGILLVAVLVAGWVSAPAIVGALAAGLVLAIPVARIVARRLSGD